MRIKVFFGKLCTEQDFEKRVNEWLEQHSDIKVSDIKFSTTENCCDVLIAYEGDINESPKKEQHSGEDSK